ncbi:MAG: inorganic phosphate transporter [Desulfobacteraceae bacterium]|nr:MAG: inorganic phosphate transporter [Desulfobacteraceae bacterium]
MEIYVFAVGLLFIFSIVDLTIGVANDAVNFLNSAVGSKVSSRRVILIVASFGILAGVTFSSGMMEVARKGIFSPRFFIMPELITIFLAVMITDIVLLDLFNTFGLPTSTTVSLVFELLGAAVAISIIKMLRTEESFLVLAQYINTGKVLAIITGILLSVGISFVCGALAQFITRLALTFNYENQLKRYGGLWGGVALSMITYFMLIKGAKGASFITPAMLAWINAHTWTILGGSFVFFTILFQLLMLFTRINILKPIVLSGTFALAMAFSGNDLVNFIGVPLAGLYAFFAANAGTDPLTLPMDALESPVQTNTFFLLAAGAVMVATLWLSRKASTVTRTEVNLGRQEEGMERFDSSQLSRIIVRMVLRLFNAVPNMLPAGVRRWVRRRYDGAGLRPAPGHAGAIPEFDLLRASVNLMVSSALVAWATSMKLPLSTTYVTFMVAMGTSLADQAWGRESAVYRVTGVLMVIGGWFFTAFSAFTISVCFAFAIGYLNGFAVFGLLGMTGYILFRNLKIHGRREKATKDLDLLDLKRVEDADYAVRTCFEHTGRFLNIVQTHLDTCFDGILTQNRRQLKDLRHQTSNVQKWSNTIVANIFKTMRLLQRGELKQAARYSTAISALQEITESLRDMILRCHVHTANQHSELLPDQRKELQQVRKSVEALLAETAQIFLTRRPFEYPQVAEHYAQLKQYLEVCDRKQVGRIRSGQSKTRLSILFYGINNSCQKISEQTLHLLDIFGETFELGLKAEDVIMIPDK